MKRWFVLAGCILLLLSGCAPVAREPDDLALVRVLGVDGASPVALTAVCARGESGETERGYAKAENFERARGRLPWSGTAEELSLTGVGYLLIGPHVDLEELLLSILEDADLGATATVWLLEEDAAVVLDACEDPAADLELLSLKGVKAPTVAQAVAVLSSTGKVSLPCLSVRDGKLGERGERQWQADN